MVTDRWTTCCITTGLVLLFWYLACVVACFVICAKAAPPSGLFQHGIHILGPRETFTKEKKKITVFNIPEFQYRYYIIVSIFSLQKTPKNSSSKEQFCISQKNIKKWLLLVEENIWRIFLHMSYQNSWLTIDSLRSLDN